jgi:hypothetical protein
MSAAKSLRRSPRQLLRELIDWARNLAYVREMVDQELRDIPSTEVGGADTSTSETHHE